MDPGNLASELYQAEFDEGLADDLYQQLAAVDRAEARLAAGTYGLSIESGEPIPDERLESVPTAEMDRRRRSPLSKLATRAHGLSVLRHESNMRTGFG